MLPGGGWGLFPFVLTVFWNNEGVILDTKWKKELCFLLSMIHVSLVISGQKKASSHFRLWAEENTKNL